MLKPLSSPISFINPHICPRCGGNFIVSEHTILGPDGKINKDCTELSEPKLICVPCHKWYSAETVKIGSETIYTLSRESTISIIQKDINNNKNINKITVENPFYIGG